MGADSGGLTVHIFLVLRLIVEMTHFWSGLVMGVADSKFGQIHLSIEASVTTTLREIFDVGTFEVPFTPESHEILTS